MNRREALTLIGAGAVGLAVAPALPETPWVELGEIDGIAFGDTVLGHAASDTFVTGILRRSDPITITLNWVTDPR